MTVASRDSTQLSIAGRLTAEARLLLCWSRPSPTSRQRTEAQSLLRAGIDWSRFARLALRHRIAPLVAAQIDSSDQQFVPETIAAGFAAVAKANASRNMRLAGELLLLARALTECELPFISLKGPALAQTADEALGLRIISDLDLLVPAGRIGPARVALEQRGFDLIQEERSDRPDLIFARQGDGLVVELHRQLFVEYDFGFAPDLGPGFEMAASASLLGKSVPVLPLEINLLYLAHHGAKHRWSRLAWLTAFSGLIDKHAEELDWASIQRLSRRYRAHGSLQLGLRLRQLCLEGDTARLSDNGSRQVSALAAELIGDAMTDRSMLQDDLSAEALLAVAVRALDPLSAAPHSIAALEGRLGLPAPPIGAWQRARYMTTLGASWHGYLGYALFTPTRADFNLFGQRRRWTFVILRPLRLTVKRFLRLVAIVPKRVNPRSLRK